MLIKCQISIKKFSLGYKYYIGALHNWYKIKNNHISDEFYIPLTDSPKLLLQVASGVISGFLCKNSFISS